MKSIAHIINNKIYAVVRADDSESAIEIANALIAGGIKSIEITAEKSQMLNAITELSKQEGVIIAAGGIITSKRAAESVEAGAKIIASPVFQDNLVKFCLSYRIPHIATVSTPNEAYNAWKARIPLIKLFPARPMGEIEYLEDLLRPMPFLDLMPAGGIGLDNFTQYLKAGAKAVGLGRCFYKDAAPAEITERAKYAVEQLRKL